MTLLAGIDLSTKQLDACFIPLDADITTPPIFRREPIARLDGSAMRIRDAGRATLELFHGLDVATCIVERPAGKGWYALLPVFGAVIARVPAHVESVAWMTAAEWRRTLGLPPGKAAAHRALTFQIPDAWFHLYAHTLGNPDEHMLDALGLALAWRQQLHQRTAA